MRLLEGLGCEVEVVENGKVAVDRARSANYDLVFMDLEMPVMDGYEAASAISDINPELPVVAMTAHAISGARERCEKVGMREYLSKPVQVHQLEELLVELFP